MPASPSRSRGLKAAPPAAQPRSRWPFILIAVAAVLAVLIATLPASSLAHFLPRSVHAEDFSGSVWHGSAGRITVNGRDAGALEWRLHPADVFALGVAADLHWVKAGFELGANARIDPQGFALRDLKGGGPIEDLSGLGVATGWHGTAAVAIHELKVVHSRILAVAGDIQVTNLASARAAKGAALGDYDLNFPEGAVGLDGGATAKLTDRGGPIEMQALVRLSPAERMGTITGTVMARADAPQAVRSELDSLSQLRGRDPQGRISVDLEFTF
jgi:hypothetical protein